MVLDQIEILITMVLYMLMIIGVGIYFFKCANANPENYFLGGRSLGPWITAMSAEASDMSGWLLMGLPSVAYWCGITDAFWTAIGLGIGTYVNWLFVSKRLRCYSETAGNAITLPEFFSKRFHEQKPILLLASAIFILLATRLMPALLAGVTMAGILAATISSSDSYLLIASSAIAKNLFHGVLKKDANDKQVMWVSRITLLLITLIGISIAMDEHSVIFEIVSFAWAGFGATFGPIMLFSLFWRKTTHGGAVAGMIAGGAMVRTRMVRTHSLK